MEKSSFKENEKNTYTNIKTQDPRCIKGNRVSKLFLIIDELCKVTMFCFTKGTKEQFQNLTTVDQDLQ